MGALTIESEAVAEPLTLDEAKSHLRYLGDGLDGEITSLIAEARDYCERRCHRTLRVGVLRSMTLSDWPAKEIKLPWPPLTAVESITYYDEAGNEHSLDEHDYHVESPTSEAGRIVWGADTDLPGLAARPDAITITFATGYTSKEAIPKTAIRAIKTKITELFGVGTENQLKAAGECTDRLLNQIDWTGYA